MIHRQPLLFPLGAHAVTMNPALESTLKVICPTLCTLAGAGLAWATFKPQSSVWGPNIHRGQTHSPEVALTFDDGPSLESTPAILDILHELNTPATFFVIGENARKHPTLLSRISSEGHILGNHSYSHSHYGIARGRQYWLRQLRMTDEMVFAAVGKRPAFFRPPMGFKTRPIARAVRLSGHHMITWSRRGRDGVATEPEHVLRRLVPAAAPGDILVLHDGADPHGPPRRQASVEALRPLIMALRGRGLRIAPLDSLLGLAAYAPAASAQKVNIRPA